MFKSLRGTAKLAKDLASASGLASAIGYFNDAQCGVASHYFANTALAEAVTFEGREFLVLMMQARRSAIAA